MNFFNLYRHRFVGQNRGVKYNELLYSKDFVF